MEQRVLAPDWHSEQFYKRALEAIVEKGEYILNWKISKITMLATLNYCRSRGLKCQWIEKGEPEDQDYDVRITANQSPDLINQ